MQDKKLASHEEPPFQSSSLDQRAFQITDAALEYLQRGWQPIPLPCRSKAPNFPKWQEFRCDEISIKKYFNGKPKNIGVLLGKASNGLVDVDLDADEAIRLASHFLPQTHTLFGRPSKLNSHWIYISDFPCIERFLDPLDGATIVEIRSTGGQTVFPPSIHPSGEIIGWHSFGETLEIKAEELRRSVGRLASAALLARHWKRGNRHNLSLSLSGGLLRNGWNVEEISDFICAICKAANDEELVDRVKAIETTSSNLGGSNKVTGFPSLAELIDKKIVDIIIKWLELKSIDTAVESQNSIQIEQKQKSTQSQLLMNIVESLELFSTPNEDCYAIVPVDDHVENIKINTNSFRSWLSRQFWQLRKKMPSTQSIQEVIDNLRGKAQFESPCIDVHVRLAEYNGEIFVDLCNPKWQAAKITTSGWQIVEGVDIPVKFRRTRGMRPLPIPQRGGSLDELQQFLNVANEDFILIKAWLVACFHPNKPFPILSLHGEHGTAKSTVVRVIRSLIDPNKSDLRSKPQNEHDLMIAANNSYIIAFDNLSYIPNELSDSLCRLATGGGFATRQLFTDTDEVLFNAIRPILLNGIEELATRPDLLDRTILLNLPVIPEENRRTEGEFWNEFRTAEPRLFGSLLDAVSTALHQLPHVNIKRKPRMADFTLFGYAAFGDIFLKRYTEIRETANSIALDSSPIANLVEQFMEGTSVWEGTATQLLSEIENIADDRTLKSKEFPKRPNVLSGLLKRIAPILRTNGINFERPNENGGRSGRLIKLEKLSSPLLSSFQSFSNSESRPPSTITNPNIVSNASIDTDYSSRNYTMNNEETVIESSISFRESSKDSYRNNNNDDNNKTQKPSNAFGFMPDTEFF